MTHRKGFLGCQVRQGEGEVNRHFWFSWITQHAALSLEKYSKLTKKPRRKHGLHHLNSLKALHMLDVTD